MPRATRVAIPRVYVLSTAAAALLLGPGCSGELRLGDPPLGDWTGSGDARAPRDLSRADGRGERDVGSTGEPDAGTAPRDLGVAAQDQGIHDGPTAIEPDVGLGPDSRAADAGGPNCQDDASGGIVHAGEVKTSITPDGVLEEAAWTLAGRLQKSVIGTGNNTATFAARWDATHLYVAVRVRDDQILEDSTSVWHDDALEIYIDARGDRSTTYGADDRQFTIGVGKRELAEARGLIGGARAGIVTGAGGYTFEIAIPWQDLELEPARGLSLGFDLGVNDDDDGGDRDSQQMWWGTNFNFRNTSGFGRLVLAPELDCPTL